MSNHWNDIGNSSCVLVMGANPSENHPACMAHINRARDRGAKLIVVDPRRTRTAVQADKYIRVRPGTDIAFVNAMVKYVIDEMESATSSVSADVKAKFFAYLNDASPGTFFPDEGGAAIAINGMGKYTDARFVVKADGTDYVREAYVDPTSGKTFSNFPKRAATVTADANTVYSRLKAHVAPYTLEAAADICGCTTSDILYVAQALIANSRCSSVGNDPRVGVAGGYRAFTHLYAMGLTQHTYGAQNVRAFAVMQTLMGNMGRAGGGINALRGIHNVQGSTDMGLLYGNIPGYSGNPSIMPAGGVTVPNDANAFGKYMDNLWGTPVNGSGAGATLTYDGSYNSAYSTAAMALQQRGFFNMTRKWFGDTTVTARADVDKIFALWPKTNGDDHITMFRKMIAGTIKGCVVWGQNPAVTEPNQSKVREGMKNLDILVVVDNFENETAAVDRKEGAVTYLVPSASYVEEAGSATNSGRMLQWRERSCAPKGNTKSDLELLLRFAKALDEAGAFSHISAVWDTIAGFSYTSVYNKLYAGYGWTPGTGSFEAVSATLEMWPAYATAPVDKLVYGSEVVAENLFREYAGGVGTAGIEGTVWIYTNGYATDRTANRHTGQAAWLVNNRAKSRATDDPNGILAFPGWGYSWLVNRRVLYNNNPATYFTTDPATHEVPGDVNDFFMGTDSVGRMFVSTTTATLNYSRWWRTVHRMPDRPDVVLLNQTTSPQFQGGVAMGGRFPAHCEPYETPRADLATKWGRNTMGTAPWDLVKADTNVAAPGRSHSASNFPLVLTTIRCVEHFQGGPITRNNPWNVEAEPEPWIEINSADAVKYGIVDGEWVNVITARSNSTTDQEARTIGAPFARGFKARVGVGLPKDQRVGPGTVAIPWHWGDRGLSTGSRANDLCIDAFDANTRIPEYKACLCKIEKA